MSAFNDDYCGSLTSIYSGCETPHQQDIKARIRAATTALKAIFDDRDVDVSSPCTAGSGSDCWLFSRYRLWNSVISDVDIKLMGHSSGRRNVGPGYLSLSLSPLTGEDLFLRLLYKQGRHETGGEEECILQACIAVHWLLKAHHCIEIVVIDKDRFTVPHPRLFFDALSVSKGVTKLVLSACLVNDKHGSELAAAVGNMSCLKYLELNYAGLSDSCLGAIGSSIASKNTLVTLKVWTSDPESLGAALLKGAKSCTNLSYLHAGVGDLGVDGAHSLCSMLRKNKGLRAVNISGADFADDELLVIAEGLNAEPLVNLESLEFILCTLPISALAVLADALMKHKALRSFQVANCALDCSGMKALTPFLKNCTHLRYLGFDDNEIRDEGAIALSECLAAARELKAVFLRNNLFTSSGAIALAKAVSQETNARLYLGSFSVDIVETNALCEALDECDDDRLRMTFNPVDVYDLQSEALSGDIYMLNEIIFSEYVTMTEYRLEELFRALSRSCTIRRLVLKKGHFDRSSARELSRFLSVNTSLKYLELFARLEPSYLIYLFEGLAENTSISGLVLGNSWFDDDATHAFVTALKCNETLSKFSRFLGDEDSLKILHAGFLENYTLLKLDLAQCPTGDAISSSINQVRLRNHKTFKRAAKFVGMNSTDSTLAVAFEKVGFSNSFLQHFRRYRKLSEVDAMIRVKAASTYMADYFPVISGIVKEKLECDLKSPSTVQIDQLNVECLQKIFSYLKVEDVIRE